jgi:hypothetical protein
MSPTIECPALFTLQVKVGAILSLGAIPIGERRVVPIVGGDLTGDGISGSVVPGGADWQIMRSDDVLEIDAHYAVRLEGGDLVEIRSQGYRFGPPEVMARMARGELVAASEYSFRAALRFRTASVQFARLNRTIGIAHGERGPDWVKLAVYAAN